MAPYTFLDDIALADVAFRATGTTVDELFRAAAEALAATMVERTETINHKTRITIQMEEPSLDLLLFSFLNELVYLKDAKGVLLLPETLTISGAGPYAIQSLCVGEPIDRDRHCMVTDVKAVTMHRLSVTVTEEGCEAIVVLDV